MSGGEFGRGPVPRQHGRIDLADFRQGRMFSGRVPLLPNRESLRATNRAPDPKTMRRMGGNERFFTHGHPAPAVRSFAEQRSRLQRSLQNSRGQFGTRGRAFTSATRGRSSFGNNRTGVRNGSRSQAFGHAGRSAPNFTQGRNGWHGFGQPGRNTAGHGVRTQGNIPSALGRNRRPFTPAPARQGGNWRTFTPTSRPSRPAGRSVSRAPAGRQGWKTFSPRQGQPRNTPPARGGVSAPVQRGGNWRAFTPSSRPSSRGGGWRGNSGRQPLNLRQPIVRRRSSGNQGPRYSQPRSQPRSFSRPAYGGNFNRGGAGRAPSYQAPRRSYGGGGGFRGGGGYRGGGSRGGYSAPRGRASGPARSSGGHGRRR